MVEPTARRQAVSYIQESYPVSLRHACGLIDLERSSCYYHPRPADDGLLRHALKTKAACRRRWDYRMLGLALKREGFTDNHKRIYRIYKEEKLQVPQRKKRRTAKYRGEKPQGASAANQRWSMDFVSDQLANGRKLRMLTIVDDFTRQCLAIEVDTSLSGWRVSRVLDRLVAQRGHPQRIVTDNGPEFTGKAWDHWAYEHKVQLDFIEPGQPVQNAFVESFNGTLRNECLNEHGFLDLQEARQIIENWRIDYNGNRPHSSLKGKTPEEFFALLSPRGEQAQHTITTSSSQEKLSLTLV